MYIDIAEIFTEVKYYLKSHGGEDDDRFSFRKRSEHIWRVFIWAKRLSENCEENINKDALLIAALFHDIGYSRALGGHAAQSAGIFHEYATNNGYEKSQADFIEYLIKNHSNKALLFSPDIPPELVLLLEADMLDETGALAITWDAMVTGGKFAGNYMEAYNQLILYSCNNEYLKENPMRTAKAREIWENKKNLMKEFIKQLEFDLAINERPGG